MAVLFWYHVKSEASVLYSILACTRHATSRGTRTTRPCITGHPVLDLWQPNVQVSLLNSKSTVHSIYPIGPITESGDIYRNWRTRSSHNIFFSAIVQCIQEGDQSPSFLNDKKDNLQVNLGFVVLLTYRLTLTYRLSFSKSSGQQKQWGDEGLMRSQQTRVYINSLIVISIDQI